MGRSENEINGETSIRSVQYGLTKRELIAAMALQGLVTSGSTFWIGVGEQATTPGHFARIATMYADALLAALASGNLKEPQSP
jgi:hypothetical protein